MHFMLPKVSDMDSILFKTLMCILKWKRPHFCINKHIKVTLPLHYSVVTLAKGRSVTRYFKRHSTIKHLLKSNTHFFNTAVTGAALKSRF